MTNIAKPENIEYISSPTVSERAGIVIPTKPKHIPNITHSKAKKMTQISQLWDLVINGVDIAAIQAIRGISKGLTTGY